jgi:MFS family permease
MSLAETPGAIAPQGPASWREVFVAAPALPVILVTVAAHMMLFGMLTPVMAVYAQSFGVSEWQIGLMITVFAVGRLAADLPAGHAAPRIGLHVLLWGGPLLCGVGSVLGALATDYATLLAGRTVQGVGSGLYMTAATIFCAQQSDRRTRGKIMSLFQGAMLVGAAFGPGVGGLAASTLGLAGPFWMSAAIGLATAAVAIKTFREPPVRPLSEPHDDGPESGRHSTALLLILPFACILAINFGIFLTRTAGQWQMIPLLATERFGLGPDEIGLAITLSAVATLAVLPLSAWLVDRVPRVWLIVVSLIAAAASLGAIVIASSDTVFYLGMIAMGLATGISGPAVAAYAVDVSPEDQQGPAMGMMRFAGDLGYLVGPLSIGALVDVTSIGHAGGLAVNAAFLAVFAILFALLAGRRTARPFR